MKNKITAEAIRLALVRLRMQGGLIRETRKDAPRSTLIQLVRSPSTDG